jgi:hypothetical protein
MMTRRKGAEDMNANKEIQDEMVGVLTAISIVSKRLANRLLDLDEEQGNEDETMDKEESAKKEELPKEDKSANNNEAVKPEAINQNEKGASK